MRAPVLSGGPFATGIGSLPFTDESAARALLERFSAEVPFAPELPKLDPDEWLLRKPFAGLLSPIDSENLEWVMLSVLEKECLPEPIRPGRGLPLLLEAASTRKPRLVKLQVAGPNVLAKHVRDVAAVWTLGERETGRRVAIERPVAFFREALARLECPAVVVFDEPSSFTAILEGTPGNHPLTRAIELARSVGAAAVGVHDCGPFFGEALAAKPDLLSFDFATYEKRLLGGEAETVAPFVRAGGSLAWGVVPTRAGEARGFDVPAAAGRVRQAATALMGGEAGGRALLERSLVTPACGTALLSPEEAVSVHEAALEVARLLRES